MAYLQTILTFLALAAWLAEGKLCGQTNCTQKCCYGSNFYHLCRTNCEGVVCKLNENCDGGYCCAGQCVTNSLQCNAIISNPSKSSTTTGTDDKGIAMWKFITIVLGSVAAGIMLCVVIVWGCRLLWSLC